MKSINIAIDGPAGAGKSTISKLAAKKLGYIYVDTGALYRAVGLNALRLKINSKDADEVTKSLTGISVDLKFIDGAQKVFLNGEDVNDEIRTPEASMSASNVSAVPSVRDFLFNLQRDIAAKNNCIMDGRDIGTVVLPNAQIKIYLTASAEERAKRRYKELVEKGTDVSYDDVLKEIVERDYNDTHRDIAPLKLAEDSILIDTTDLSLDDSAAKIIDIINNNL